MSPLLHIDFVNNSTPEPIVCPLCNQLFSLRSAQDEALSTGLSFAHCGQIVFQVVKCHTSDCPARFVMRCKADAPAIDMRELILTPEKTTISNGLEQYSILQQYDHWHDKLKFKYLKAWDEEKFPQKEFIEYYNLLSEIIEQNKNNALQILEPPEQIDNNEHQDEDYEYPELEGGLCKEDNYFEEVDPRQSWADEINTERDRNYEYPELEAEDNNELPHIQSDHIEEYTPDYQPEEHEWVNDDGDCPDIDEIEKANKQILNAIEDSSDKNNSVMFISEERFYELLDAELKQEQERFSLKRLYPDTLYYRSLLICAAPFQIRRRTYDNKHSDTDVRDGLSQQDIDGKIEALKTLISIFKGRTLLEIIRQELEAKRLALPDKKIQKSIYNLLALKRLTTTKKFHLALRITDGFSFSKFLCDELYEEIYKTVSAEAYLAAKRTELLKWSNDLKKGTARFVDAPMGIGKTYSIVGLLSSNQTCSAIIFMPTKRLCEEICNKLIYYILKNNKVYANLDKDLDETSVTGSARTEQYTRRFMERNGVYYMDGINKEECLCFDKITEQYSKRWFSKKNICDRCPKQPECRFLKHQKRAFYHRIIVTTHAMYDHILQGYKGFAWGHNDRISEQDIKKKKENTDIPLFISERDMFIVDEDIVWSKCYQPICIDENELRIFTSTITSFLNDEAYFKNKPVSREVFLKIDSILAQYIKCDITSYIPPIDTEFEFSKYIKNRWADSFKEQPEIIPYTLEISTKSSVFIGNYLDFIENTIKKGFVVQSYKINKDGSSVKPYTKTPADDNSIVKVKKGYFANPKTYKFDSDTPAHVFFDGTLSDITLLEHKLEGAKIDISKIQIDEPLWEMKVWQNINTDLPKSKLIKNEGKVKELITQIIKEVGVNNKKYFILTSKALREQIEDWLKTTYQTTYIQPTHIVIEHYGNLRGLNNAKECDTGIVLGSYMLSDAIEITMALDFIYKNFKSSNPVALTTEDNLWSWQGCRGVRKYKEEFEIIEKIANQYRHAEYRQALARTRYLEHPVNFYVFSKDIVTDYEPFVTKLETEQYKADIFPPVRRSDNKDAEIEAVVLKYLESNKYVSATDIHESYKIRRQTVGKCLQRMFEAGILIHYIDSRNKKYKKRFALNK